MAKKFQIDTWWTLMTSLKKFWNGNWTAFDYWSNSLSGWTYNGTTGLIWNAQNCNGTTTYRLDAPDDTEYPSGGNYSINVWVNFTALPTSWNFMSFVNKYDVTNNGWYDIWVYNNAWTVQINNLFVNSSWNWQVNSNNYTFSTSTWYMVTAVLNGTSLSTYVNGSLLWSTTITWTPADNTKKLYIWWFWTYTPSGTDLWRLLNGKIQLVGIWGKNLTTTEISDLYNGWAANALIDGTNSNMLMFF